VAKALRGGFTGFKDSEHLRREEKLEEMDDEDLERWVKKRPKDVLARWKWSERLKENGDLDAYVREREQLLLMKSGLDVSEKSTLFHQLADFCLKELRQPERGRQALEKFVAAHPKAPEAIPTCVRIRRIEAQMAQEWFADKLGQELSRQGYPASTRLKQIKQRTRKALRIEALLPDIQSGRIRFQRHQRELLEQFEMYPMHRHDDGPDAVSMAYTAAKTKHRVIQTSAKRLR
jgi:predicted phage terminase large subunit-like protein